MEESRTHGAAAPTAAGPLKHDIDMNDSAAAAQLVYSLATAGRNFGQHAEHEAAAALPRRQAMLASSREEHDSSGDAPL